MLIASSDSPTLLGNATTLLGTLYNATGFTFTWDFGDSLTDSGAGLTHTYASIGAYTATVTATNGISNAGGIVIENYNLFSGNGADRLSVVTGTNGLTGNPAFANPSANDYHLTAGSAAINAGANAGVTSDFEGDARPQGLGFDIGYDESLFSAAIAGYRAFLPLVVR